MKGNVPRAERSQTQALELENTWNNTWCSRTKGHGDDCCLRVSNRQLRGEQRRWFCNLMKRGETLFKWVGCTGSLAWQPLTDRCVSRRLLSGERRETEKGTGSGCFVSWQNCPLASLRMQTYLLQSQSQYFHNTRYIHVRYWTSPEKIGILERLLF